MLPGVARREGPRTYPGCSGGVPGASAGAGGPLARPRPLPCHHSLQAKQASLISKEIPFQGEGPKRLFVQEQLFWGSQEKAGEALRGPPAPAQHLAGQERSHRGAKPVLGVALTAFAPPGVFWGRRWPSEPATRGASRGSGDSRLPETLAPGTAGAAPRRTPCCHGPVIQHFHCLEVARTSNLVGKNLPPCGECPS